MMMGPDRIHWGGFDFLPEKNILSRAEGSLRIPLTPNQAGLLGALLEQPEKPLSYGFLKQTIPGDLSARLLQQTLEELRPILGDFNFGPNPQMARRGFWRYVNYWGYRTRWEDPDTLSGLILNNHTTDDYIKSLQAHPDNPSVASFAKAYLRALEI